MSFHSILVLVSVLSQQQKVSEHINYDSTRQEDEVPNTFIYVIYLALMLINFFTIFQNFIHVYNKTWLYPLPLILSRCSHIPSICSTPNFNIFIFSNINNHVHMWMGWGHFLERGKHINDYILKMNDSPFSNNYQYILIACSLGLYPPLYYQVLIISLFLDSFFLKGFLWVSFLSYWVFQFHL